MWQLIWAAGHSYFNMVHTHMQLVWLQLYCKKWHVKDTSLFIFNPFSGMVMFVWIRSNNFSCTCSTDHHPEGGQVWSETRPMSSGCEAWLEQSYKYKYLHNGQCKLQDWVSKKLCHKRILLLPVKFMTKYFEAFDPWKRGNLLFRL